MRRLALKDKVSLMLLVGAILTNPLLGQYVLTAMDFAFRALFSIGAYVTLVAVGWMLVLLAVQYVKSERLNIPSKTAKTNKAGKFIEA